MTVRGRGKYRYKEEEKQEAEAFLREQMQKYFPNNEILYIDSKITHNELSDKVSSILKKKGMKFVGTIIIYSYLQAIGVINSHECDCFKFKGLT